MSIIFSKIIKFACQDYWGPWCEQSQSSGTPGGFSEWHTPEPELISVRDAVKCHQLFSHLVTVEGSRVRGDAFNPSHHNFASEENFSHCWSRVWCQQVQVINIFIKPIKLVSKTEIFCWHLHFQLKNNLNINWLIKLVFSLLINCLPLLIITA